MIVYHTSDIEIIKPDIKFSREGLDFGKGFYVTKLREQAEKYGDRFKLRGKDSILNIYDLDDLPENVITKQFCDYNEEWLDFVMDNRAGKLPPITYSVVEGGVADDKIFRTIDLYFSGDITKEEALGRLRFEKPNNQICLLDQKVIDNHLKFINSIRL